MPPMPFVKRNLEQQIVGLSISQDNVAETVEFVPADSAEIQNFLAEHFLPIQSQALVAEDIALVRVLEDVVDLLITRNFITFSDLPIPAQNKLLAKKGMRERLIASTNNLLVTEKPLL
jgi:hypothetical protein